MQSALHALSYQSSQQAREVDVIITDILQMRKLRNRAPAKGTQDRAATFVKKCSHPQSQDSNNYFAICYAGQMRNRG